MLLMLRIYLIYKPSGYSLLNSEVGLLDVGQPTPQLTKLVDEKVLTPAELERLRRGAPQ